MGIVFKNNAKTTLASNLTSSATSASVTDGSVFPSLSAGEFFLITFDDGTNNEICKCTARSGNTLTIVRAQESTTARSFSSGDAAEGRVTAGVLETIQENIAAKSANQTVYSTTTASSATSYDIGIDPGVEANASVFLDGVYQHHDTFSFSGSTLTFDAAPVDGTALEVIVDNLINLQSSNLTVDTFTAADVNGNPQTDFVLSDTPAAETNLIVFIDGVFQDQDAYTISNNTLTITDGVTADFGVTVYVINPVNIGTPSDGTVTSAKLSGNITMPGTLTVGSNDVAFDSPTFVVDNANSRVGLGTASPSVPVDIVGDVKMSANLTVDTSTLHVDSTNNRVGIGTANPSTALEINDDAGTVSTLTGIASGGVTSVLMKQSRGTIASPVNSSTNGDGNYIVSQIYRDAGYNSNAWIGLVTDTNADDGRIVFGTASSGTVAEKMRVDALGRVGIATDSPTEKLEVKGALGLQATNSTNRWSVYNYTDNTFRLNYNGSGADELILNTSGRLAVGATTLNAGITSGTDIRSTGAAFANDANSISMSQESSGGVITARGPSTSQRGTIALSVNYSTGGGGLTALQIGNDGYITLNSNRSEYALELNSLSSRAGLVVNKPGTSTVMGSLLMLSSDETYRLGTASNYHLIMDQTGKNILGNSGTTNPASVNFANVLAAGAGDTSRACYFDGNGATACSVWWGSGTNAYSAIDSNDGTLDIWINNSGGTWYNISEHNESGFNLRKGTLKIDNGTNSSTDAGITVNSTSSNTFNHTINCFNSNLTAGESIINVLGKAGNSKNAGYLGYTWNANASNENYVHLSHWGSDYLFKVYGNGNVIIGNGSNGQIWFNGSGSYNNYNESIRIAAPANHHCVLAFGAGGTNSVTASGTPSHSILYATNTQLYTQRNSAGSTIYSLNSSGAASFAGAVTQNTSDERLKENIEVIPNAITKLKAIRGVTFDWKETTPDEMALDIPASGHDVGVLAQEVQAVLPEAVSLAPFDTSSQTYNEDDIDADVEMGDSKTGENYLTVDYQKLVPLLIESIKELEARIEELENG